MFSRILECFKWKGRELIKFCPICESKRIGINHFKKWGFTSHYAIICNNCGYKEAHRSKRKAINKWNDRHIKVWVINF